MFRPREPGPWRVAAPNSPRTISARRLTRATVRARHSTTRDEETGWLVACHPGVTGVSTPPSMSRPPVPVFRQRGQPVHLGDGDSRGAQGFYQGIRQPLGELVKGHKPQRGIGPDVPQVLAVAHRGVGPQGRQLLQESPQQSHRRQAPIRGEAGEQIVEASHPPARPSGGDPTQGSQQRGPVFGPHQGIVLSHLKGFGQRSGGQARQRFGVRPGKTAVGEHTPLPGTETGYRQPFGPSQLTWDPRVGVTPPRPAPCVQQDRYHDEFDLGPG